MTKIEWCDKTLNPQGWGCFGPGGTHDNPRPCSYCYAKRMAARMLRTCELCNQFIPHYHPEVMEWPYRWKKPRKIFWQSMGDLFHPHTPDWLIQGVLAVVEANPRHTSIFLTKNPRRLKEFNPWPANCWVGTTVTNQADADERIPELLKADALVRFLSVEPILSEIKLRKTEAAVDKEWAPRWEFGHIDWVIIGAQTGPGAVELKTEWITNLGQQCRHAGIPIFLKDNLGFANQPKEWPKESI